MDKGINKQILKKLYRHYKETNEHCVNSAKMAELFRIVGIHNGTQNIKSKIEKDGFLNIDEREQLCITEGGMSYLNRVSDRYEELGGLIRNGELVNKDKENRAFTDVDEEIKNEQSSTKQSVFNIKDSQLHFGKGDKVGRDKIEDKQEDSTPWLKYLAVLVPILGFFWGVYIYINPNVQEEIKPISPDVKKSDVENGIATSTQDISNLLSKAVSLDTVMERQDFLTKYKGDQVYGDGIVKQISRYPKGFLVDIKINNQTIVCPQKDSEENEKRLLFLKGKTVRIFGTFIYEQLFDHDGLVIEDCGIQELN